MIQVENVTKRYGDRKALKDISFSVDEGEIVGLLGPNGAGKSTTMNIITGYISATEGNVKIADIDILENPSEAKKNIGYLPEIPPLYTDMTVEEYLSFVSDIKKVNPSEKDKNIKYVMDLVKIEDVKGRLIKNLSKGYKQRVGLAQAIIGDPKLLILDEPTVGLDPKQIIEIRNLIKDLGKKHTIILSSHILSEVSAVCDRVLIMNKGEIVASGTPKELSKRLSYSNKFILRVKGSKNEILNAIKTIDGLQSVKSIGSFENETIDVDVEAKKDVDIRESLFRCLSKNNLPILMMKSSDLSLEEVFLQVTNEEEEEIV